MTKTKTTAVGRLSGFLCVMPGRLWWCQSGSRPPSGLGELGHELGIERAVTVTQRPDRDGPEPGLDRRAVEPSGRCGGRAGPARVDTRGAWSGRPPARSRSSRPASFESTPPGPVICSGSSPSSDFRALPSRQGGLCVLAEEVQVRRSKVALLRLPRDASRTRTSQTTTDTRAYPGAAFNPGARR